MNANIICQAEQAPCRNRDTVRYVGYSASANETPGFDSLFSEGTINMISKAVTHYIGKDLANGRPIIVPNERILSVMSEMVHNYNAETGDIFTRLNIPNNNEDMCQKMVYRTITVIVDNVRNTLEMENINGKLSIWDTVLGEFNEKGLRAHAPLTAEIDNTRRLFQFNMNY